MIKCTKCGENKTQKEYASSPKKGRHSWCRACENIKNKASYHKRRREAVAILGDSCVWCGHVDPVTLQIDHINNDEAKERKNRSGMHKRIIEGETDAYQLLCSNCNWRKRLGYDGPYRS